MQKRLYSTIRFLSIIMMLFSILHTTQAGENKPIYMIRGPVKMVALTFDDGPDNNVPKILALLEKFGAKATFFVLGKKVEKDPEITKLIVKSGSEIGNHSYSHPLLPKLTQDEIKEQIEKTQKIVKDVAGVTPAVFRAPNLKYDAKVWQVINDNNLRAVNSNASVSDWNKATTKEQIIERATVKIEPGSIILMHTWPEKTLEALPEILQYLKDNGYTFVTMSEMIKIGGK